MRRRRRSLPRRLRLVFLPMLFLPSLVFLAMLFLPLLLLISLLDLIMSSR